MLAEYLINFFIFIFGLCVGSFLNCVIYRLEKEEKLNGRSYCPNCKHTLNWRDLVPVFSFLFLRGKCRYCSRKISWQYPAVEISTALAFLLIFNYQLSTIDQFSIIQFSNLINLLFLFYIASALIVIFVYDLKHYIIPDKILFPAIIITLIYRVYESLGFGIWNLSFGGLRMVSGAEPFRISDFEFWISVPLVNYVFAALLSSGFFLAIYLLSAGRWMGFGDVKLAILMGFILGFPGILIGLFLSFFFGAIIGTGLMVANEKGLSSEIPFAPFLIAGTFSTMLWGQTIMNWYASLIFI